MGEHVEPVTVDEFAPNYARAFVEHEVKAIDDSARSVTHLITTGSVDRMGDIVEPGGALLDNFKRNPVVLANHDYRIESVIGKARDMSVTRNGIVSTTIFRETPLADAAFRLAKERIGGWSIGFRPTESHSIADGAKAGCKTCKGRFAAMAEGKSPGDYVPGSYARHFVGWEMLEYSSVAIPANQDIVNNAITRGLVSSEVADRFFACPITPRPSAEAVPGPTAKAVGVDPVIADALRKATKRLDAAALQRLIRETLERVRA